MNFSDNLCRLLANTNATNDLSRIVEVAREIMLSTVYKCHPITYEHTVEAYKESDWYDGVVFAGVRQIFYQQCAGLGWFPTTNSAYQPFGSGFSTELFYSMCKDTFDNK